MRLRGLPLTLTRPFPAWIERKVSIPFSVHRSRKSSNLALGNCGGSLLLAEALNALSCRGHICGWRDSRIRRRERDVVDLVVLNFSELSIVGFAYYFLR